MCESKFNNCKPLDMEINRKNYIKFSISDIEKIEKIGNEIVSRLEDLK